MGHKLRILVLTTYPLRKSIHGGQRRSRAIVEAYKRAGCTVLCSAVFNPPAYANADERGADDLPAPELTQKHIFKQPILEDVILGRACYDDPLVKNHIERLISNFRPDYIDFEQPYLYIGVQHILKELENPPMIIFSSHNIEYKMKARIYAGHSDQISGARAKENERLIKETEVALCKNAIITLAVSSGDAVEHKKMGAKKVLVIPNGINAGKLSRRHVEKWQHFFRGHGISNSILFTGSAHPPNWTGFLEMMGGRLGFLPITSKLMIVGDIGDALEYVLYQRDPVYSSSFWLRAHNCKRLSDDDLTALIHLSKTIILPITEGGGSNLKTAEAIYAKKYIVTTSYAMRGYEEFSEYSNLLVTNNPTEFKEAIVRTLDFDAPVLTPDQLTQTIQVLWESRTKPLEETIRKEEL